MEKFMKSKFKGVCAETGKTIKKGDSILFDTVTRKVYSVSSKRYKDAAECKSTSGFIEAQENAYFDNFCWRNKI